MKNPSLTDMLDRTIAPPFNRNARFQLLPPDLITLPNGIKSYFISAGQQDVIKVEVLLRAGRWYEEKWGTSHFTTNLLLKGTLKKKSSEIAQIFDLYGAHIDLSAGLDMISVSLYSLNKYLDPALSLLFEVLTESVFPAKELDQAKTIFLQNLQVNNEKTSFLASKSFRKAIFGDDHPYGKEFEETDVSALSEKDLKDHYQKYCHDVQVLVSGRVESDTKKKIVDIFSAIEVRRVDDKMFSLPSGTPQRIVGAKDGSLQASIRMGKRFIPRTNAKYPEVLLINHILGGYFGSRLMKNIREEKGLSYGIYSSIHTLCNDSYIAIGSDVNKENLDLTFAEIEKELDRLCEDKIPVDELEVARNHFIGSLQAELSTPFAHADKLKNILLFALPADYYQNLIDTMSAATPEILREVAKNHFAKNSFYEIAIG